MKLASSNEYMPCVYKFEKMLNLIQLNIWFKT